MAIINQDSGPIICLFSTEFWDNGLSMWPIGTHA